MYLYTYMSLTCDFSFQPVTTRSPLTLTTSSPTLRWLTRAGGEASAEELTVCSQPTMWRFGNDDPPPHLIRQDDLSPCPATTTKKKENKEGDIFKSPFLFIPFLSSPHLSASTLCETSSGLLSGFSFLPPPPPFPFSDHFVSLCAAADREDELSLNDSTLRDHIETHYLGLKRHKALLHTSVLE